MMTGLEVSGGVICISSPESWVVSRGPAVEEEGRLHSLQSRS